MQLSEGFIAFQQDIGTCDLHSVAVSLPADHWLLELNIDPLDAILEFRRFVGDPKGTCLRNDWCLSVRLNEIGVPVIDATEVSLEDFGYWPVTSDWQARQRAQKVVLPFLETSLLEMDATADGDAILLELMLADASAKVAEKRLLRVRLGAEFCEVIR